MNVTGWPESCTDTELMGTVPVFSPWILKSGLLPPCRFVLSIFIEFNWRWCLVWKKVEPPVWTAMFVCSQSMSLLVAWVQNGDVEERLVAGSAVLLTNWSDVYMITALPVIGLAATPKSSSRSLLPVHVTPASHTPP